MSALGIINKWYVLFLIIIRQQVCYLKLLITQSNFDSPLEFEQTINQDLWVVRFGDGAGASYYFGIW